jgi:isocitrate dehydrogenase
MLLDSLGCPEAARRVEAAYGRVVAVGIVTYDFARQMAVAREVRTSEFATAPIEAL